MINPENNGRGHEQPLNSVVPHENIEEVSRVRFAVNPDTRAAMKMCMATRGMSLTELVRRGAVLAISADTEGIEKFIVHDTSGQTHLFEALAFPGNENISDDPARTNVMVNMSQEVLSAFEDVMRSQPQHNISNLLNHSINLYVQLSEYARNGYPVTRVSQDGTTNELLMPVDAQESFIEQLQAVNTPDDLLR